MNKTFVEETHKSSSSSSSSRGNYAMLKILLQVFEIVSVRLELRCLLLSSSSCHFRAVSAGLEYGSQRTGTSGVLTF